MSKGKLSRVEVIDNWKDSMFFDFSANYDSFFTEHDTTQDDGFAYMRGPNNEVIGMTVEGERYFD